MSVMAELSEHSDPISTLRPVLNEIVTGKLEPYVLARGMRGRYKLSCTIDFAEDRQRRCITRIAPTFWSNFNEDLVCQRPLKFMLCTYTRFLFSSQQEVLLMHLRLQSNS